MPTYMPPPRKKSPTGASFFAVVAGGMQYVIKLLRSDLIFFLCVSVSVCVLCE